ncbi:MAG: hypothetical protein ACLR31_10195 [Escherichia coli]
MENNGQLLTEAQKEQYRAANRPATAFDRLTDGLSNQAILGFFDGAANMPTQTRKKAKPYRMQLMVLVHRSGIWLTRRYITDLYMTYLRESNHKLD